MTRRHRKTHRAIRNWNSGPPRSLRTRVVSRSAARVTHPPCRVLQCAARIVERIGGLVKRLDALLEEHHRDRELEQSGDDRSDPHMTGGEAPDERGEKDRG